MQCTTKAQVAKPPAVSMWNHPLFSHIIMCAININAKNYYYYGKELGNPINT